MLDMWIDCLIAGIKDWDGVKASRKAEVKAELDRRLAAGEISQSDYNRIFGIEQEQDLANAEAEDSDGEADTASAEGERCRRMGWSRRRSPALAVAVTSWGRARAV